MQRWPIMGSWRLLALCTAGGSTDEGRQQQLGHGTQHAAVAAEVSDSCSSYQGGHAEMAAEGMQIWLRRWKGASGKRSWVVAAAEGRYSHAHQAASDDGNLATHMPCGSVDDGGALATALHACCQCIAASALA
jgi:hypothetical protein